MALTREQELFLMRIGLDALHRELPTVKELKQSRTVIERTQARVARKALNKTNEWTPERRRRYARMMRKKWRAIKANGKTRFEPGMKIPK